MAIESERVCMSEVTNKSKVNADAAELRKFSELAHKWWDKASEFKPLHDINPLRLNYLNMSLDNAFEVQFIIWFPFFSIFQTFGNFLHQAFRNIVIDIEFGIAGNFQGKGLMNIVIEIEKNVVKAKPDDIIEHYHVLFLSRFWQNQKTWYRERWDADKRVSKIFGV